MLSRLLINWPYKLAALIVAIALHAYVSHINDPHITKTINVPLILKSTPANLQISDATPEVALQISGPTSSLDAITPSSYIAAVDLSRARAGANQALPITVNDAPGVPQDVVIESSSPRTAMVVMENKIRKQLVVAATFPSVSPAGLSYGAPKVVPPVASVEGPESSVNRVARLMVHGDDAMNGEKVAPGLMEGFGEVVPLDAQDQPVSGVTIMPEQAELRIAVSRETAVKELIVNPTLIGLPAYPAQVTDVKIQPARLAVTGPTDLLAQASVLATAPLDVTGLKSDVVRQLAVTLPRGLRLAAGEASAVTITVRVSAPAESASAPLPAQATAPAQLKQ